MSESAKFEKKRLHDGDDDDACSTSFDFSFDPSRVGTFASFFFCSAAPVARGLHERQISISMWWQEDIAPSHTSRRTKAFLKECEIQLLTWPP